MYLWVYSLPSCKIGSCHLLFNLVPVNICSSVYLTPVYVLPPSSRQKKDRKILGYLKGITRSINLSSGYLRVRTVCPSHTPKHKTPYTFIYFQLSVMFGESFRLVVACCCSFFVIAGSVPLRVKKLRLCFAVGVGQKHAAVLNRQRRNRNNNKQPLNETTHRTLPKVENI